MEGMPCPQSMLSLACLRISHDRVYLSSPLSPDPVTGAMSVRTMTWEKVG